MIGLRSFLNFLRHVDVYPENDLSVMKWNLL